jgi:hypothetical protein
MRIILLSVLFSLSIHHAWGQSFIQLDGDGSKKSSKKSKSKKASKEDIGPFEQKSSHSLGLSYLPGEYAYELRASGSTSIDYSALAHKLEVYSSHWLRNGLGVEGKLSYLKFEFDKLSSGITPNIIGGSRLETKILLKNKLTHQGKNLDGLVLRYGHRYMSHDVDTSTPLQMTNFKAQFFGLGLQYLWSFQNGSYLDLWLDWFSATDFDETPSKSGRHEDVSLVELALNYNMRFSDSWLLSMGPKIEKFKQTFEGSDTRQTTDAEVNEMFIQLNLGVIYEY